MNENENAFFGFHRITRMLHYMITSYSSLICIVTIASAHALTETAQSDLYAMQVARMHGHCHAG